MTNREEGNVSRYIKPLTTITHDGHSRRVGWQRSGVTGTLVVFLIFPMNPLKIKHRCTMEDQGRLSIMLSLSPRPLPCQISTWTKRTRRGEKRQTSHIPSRAKVWTTEIIPRNRG